MAKMLYVTSNLKPAAQSRSLTVAREFLDAYLLQHPEDEVDFLDLYRDNIQRIDMDVLSGWDKLGRGDSVASLTEDEQRKVVRIVRLTDQFIAADKYVFVTPMWNLGFPAEFKMYIDAVCIAGKTYRYTSTGTDGLLKGQGRKCLHIHSSGGFHLGRADDHSVPYLKSIMNFMGVEDFEAIVLEGVDVAPEREEEFTRQAIQQAVETAGRF